MTLIDQRYKFSKTEEERGEAWYTWSVEPCESGAPKLYPTPSFTVTGTGLTGYRVQYRTGSTGYSTVLIFIHFNFMILSKVCAVPLYTLGKDAPHHHPLLPAPLLGRPSVCAVVSTQRRWDVAVDDPAERAELFPIWSRYESVQVVRRQQELAEKERLYLHWEGVCCIEQDGHNRITELHVERNGLRGAFSSTFAGVLTELQVIDVHLNYVTNFPPGVSRLTNLQQAKFGRNPICGNATELLSEFAPLTKLTKFNCNFCCLSGEFPDSVLANKPMLEEIYWDGNNFTGPIPPSAGRLPSLTKISFNLNSMVGPFPSGLTKKPPLLNLTDCRFGSDTDFAPVRHQSRKPGTSLVAELARQQFYWLPLSPSVLDSICNAEGKGYTPSPLDCRHAGPTR